jgi:hypothetical protein
MSNKFTPTVDSSDRQDADPSDETPLRTHLRSAIATEEEPTTEGAESNVFFRGEDFRKLPSSVLAELAAAETTIINAMPMPPMKGEPANGEESSVPSVKTSIDIAVQDQAYDIEVLQEQNITMASQVALLSDQLERATKLLMGLQHPPETKAPSPPLSDSISMHTGDLRAGTMLHLSSHGTITFAVYILRATTTTAPPVPRTSESMRCVVSDSNSGNTFAQVSKTQSFLLLSSALPMAMLQRAASLSLSHSLISLPSPFAWASWPSQHSSQLADRACE